MFYQSTRAKDDKPKGFLDVVLGGLSPDGGLYVPCEFPFFEITEFNECQSYVEFALKMMRPFISEVDIPTDKLLEILSRSYQVGPDQFKVEGVVEVQELKRQTDDESFPSKLSLLNLWHGPTDAFKDVALQFLGEVYEYIYATNYNNVQEWGKKKLMVLGATSGDTGAAALSGMKRCSNVAAVILYPLGGVSDVQEALMLKLAQEGNSNLAAVAVRDSDFDQCQTMVKELFLSHKNELGLVAVNSINWCRILAQMVYFWKSSHNIFSKTSKKINVVVPTGNFGNVLAAYYAKLTGAPIHEITIASNSNNILTRLHETGVYELTPVLKTYSPSMDIQVSSNFERFLFAILDHSEERTKSKLEGIKNEGKFTLTPEELKAYNKEFKAAWVSEDDTLRTMRSTREHYGAIICPHSAVAVGAAFKHANDTQGASTTTLVAATAKYTKFPAAFEDAFKQPAEGRDAAAKIISTSQSIISNNVLSVIEVIERVLMSD